MDLRARKTRRALRDAFRDMRRELPLERVTVRALCERAEVGKATFYLHYHSVYDLSRELQREAVRSIVDELSDPSALFESPATAARELFSLIAAHHDEVDALFSDGQEHVLAEILEEELRRRLPGTDSSSTGDVRTNALLTYLVEGSYHAYVRFARRAGAREAAEVIDAIGEASEAVVRVLRS